MLENRIKYTLIIIFSCGSLMCQEINDSTCNCLPLYNSSKSIDINCQENIVKSIEINILNDSVKLYEYLSYLTDEERYNFKLKALEALYRKCEKKGYVYTSSLNQLNDENNSVFSSPAIIKILGIFLLTIFAGIVKEYINSRQNKRSQEVATLLQRVKKIDLRNLEMKLMDTFELSSYEGLWQNFTKGFDEDRFKLSIYNNAFEIEMNGSWSRLYFNDILNIGYKTKSRGRYGALVDTYLFLNFNQETLEYSENIDNDNAEKFASMFKVWRIRKGNAPLHGEKTKAEFNELLVATFKSLGG